MILKPIKKYGGRLKNSALQINDLHKKSWGFGWVYKLILFFISVSILVVSSIAVWVSTLNLPDFNDFENRIVQKSTKIYDREGTMLLFDIHRDYKRTVIPFDEMGENIKKATVAIEDDNFYQHIGVRPLSIIRAVYYNFRSGRVNQGGSTITQQIIKNTLLSSEKTITRKIKELVLAIRIEQKLSKDEILAIYLNESPYGGNIYGVEQASQSYFGKHAKDLSVAEAAYIASIPQRPTYFFPFGKNTDKLNERKNYGLKRMRKLGMITEEEYQVALQEPILLSPSESKNLKAPHFVFYIQDYLVEKYGEDLVNKGGLRVITTLDYDLQRKAEEIVKQEALSTLKQYNAENMAMVGLDAKKRQILFMVGSRDYFDETIDGQYNVATAKRQPGSAFKPFVYALAFEKGYLPESLLIDVPTEFNPGCAPGGFPVVQGSICYSPKNYDGSFRGLVPIKKALGASLNIPAVQMLYLVGVDNAISFAENMGISTLSQKKDAYGLSLVLGGAEVKLVEMVNAYGVFANKGLYRKETGILKITDSNGTVLEEYKDEEGIRVMSEDTALKMSDVLSKDENRTLVFAPGSSLVVQGHTVAAKTGTTNNFKDAWIIGYSPDLVIGAWAGNNDARPMTETGSTIAGPAWNKMFVFALNLYKDRFPNTSFESPKEEDLNSIINPVIKGSMPSYRSLLYYIDKNNPRGSKPQNPASDPQFKNWEASVLGYFGPPPEIIPVQTPTEVVAPVPNEPQNTSTED